MGSHRQEIQTPPVCNLSRSGVERLQRTLFFQRQIPLFPSLKTIQDACKPPEKWSPCLHDKTPSSHGSRFRGDRVREPTGAASLLYLQASERPSQGNPGPLLSCSPRPLVFSATVLGENPQLCIPKGPQKFSTDSESDHPAQGQLITERGTPSCPPDPEKKPTSSVFPPSFIRTTEESP